jgi:hypothetical protein
MAIKFNFFSLHCATYVSGKRTNMAMSDLFLKTLPVNDLVMIGVNS